MFKDLLPSLDERNNLENPEKYLLELSHDFNSTYEGKIFSTVITNSNNSVDGDEQTLDFTLLLIFLNHNDFTYPLIKVKVLNADGQFPIEVTSHYSPPVEHGKIYKPEKFINVLKTILKDEKTRNIILSMY